MRKKRDAEGTKFKILETAEKIFASKGYNGTSIAMISRASGISDGLILYHFGTKENLYKQVIESTSARYLKVVTGPLETGSSIEEAMKNSLIAVFNFWKNDKTCQRIGLWAYLENRENTSSNEAQLTEKLTEYLLSLQQIGAFPEDIHPVIFLTVIIGSIQFWFRYKSRFNKTLKLDKQYKDFDNIFLGQFAKILEKTMKQK